MNPMWQSMPPLVDREGGIPPPPGAVIGGHPDIHGAFPGYQQRQQQQPAPWWVTAAAQGTPWANAGGASWANTPGSSWANTPASSGWANTPAPAQTPWPQQQPPHQQGWGLPPIPRQGWDRAPAPQASSWAQGTPWDHLGEPPPQSAPASLSHGFSAMAAPPEQPVTNTSWFGPAAAAERRYHQGGMPGGMDGLEEGEEFFDYEAEEAALAREDAHDPHMRQHRVAAWAQATGQHDPRATGQHDPWATGQHDPRATWPRGWSQEELALTRARSLGQQSPKQQKKRPNSLGRGQLQSWRTNTFDEHHLSRRPDDWRDGYSPRTGIGADLSFSSLFRRKTESGEFTDSKKRELNRALVFSANRPNIAYDMRCDPDVTEFFGAFRPHQRDMLQPAVTPAATRMRLVHPRLPWYVDVRRPQGITIYDVLRTLYDELSIPIAGRDFWNEELGRRDRDSLTEAFKERCQLDGREHAKAEMLKGVKRVDFLGTDVIFLGFARRNGMWEIKTTNEH